MTVGEIPELINEFRRVYRGLGLIGNASFSWAASASSRSTKPPVSGLFIVGAGGMLIGSVGEVIVRYERRELGI